MLTKKQKAVLDLLIKQMPYGTEFSEFLLYGNGVIPDGRFEFDELADICTSLEHVGCLRDLEISSTGIVRHLSLTYEGRHYKEFSRMRICRFFKERLVVFVFGVLSGVIVGYVLFLVK